MLHLACNNKHAKDNKHARDNKQARDNKKARCFQHIGQGWQHGVAMAHNAVQ